MRRGSAAAPTRFKSLWGRAHRRYEPRSRCYAERLCPIVHGWSLTTTHRSIWFSFPAHALLILEERLREQEAEGVEMPEGRERDELALMILLAAELSR
jgi:hypothetical protein